MTGHPLATCIYMTVACLWMTLMYAALVREGKPRPRPKCQQCADAAREAEMTRDLFRAMPAAWGATMCLMVSVLWPVSLARGIQSAQARYHRHETR